MNWTSRKNPNPQGKGLVALAVDWEATRPRAATQKQPAELVFDWFVSALVLSSRFSMRPALGQDYYLYARGENWQLSLVGPGEWGENFSGECLGRCCLREDMTWELTPADDLAERPDLLAALARLAQGFMESLDSEESLEAQLPAYRRDLPYYQRMLATGLGASLRDSAGASLEAPTQKLLAEARRSLPARLGVTMEPPA